MQTSNTLKSILIFCVLNSLVACNLPSPKDEKSKAKTTTATFSAEAMPEKSRTIETYNKGVFGLPSAKIFNFNACIKDNAYDKPVIGHKFLVEETKKEVTSDKSGCITWEERIEFNFLGQSQYLRMERHISGLGLHKGTQLVAYAINPWSHGENLPSVLNPNDGKIDRLENDPQKVMSGLKGFTSDNQIIKRKLWVEDGRLFTNNKKMTGSVLSVEMRLKPLVKLTKMNGDDYDQVLANGKFKARLMYINIYNDNENEVRRVIAESALSEYSMDSHFLSIPTDMKLKFQPTRGRVMLGLELEPIAEPGLVKFEGLFLLGDYDQFKSTSFLTLNSAVKNNAGFKLNTYVNSSIQEIIEKAKDDAELEDYQKSKIIISELRFEFLRIGTEKTASREIFYRTRTCLRNVDQKSILSRTFKITKFHLPNQEAKFISVKTDNQNNSCLTWDDSITINPFECQHYLKGTVKIENPELEMDENVEVALNPWAKGNIDARDLRPSFAVSNENLPFNCEIGKRQNTKIFMKSYGYDKASVDSYDIDSFLNLNITKKVRLTIDPRLLMYSSLNRGTEETSAIRNGFYLLRTAIIQNPDFDSSNKLVASADSLVKVDDGTVNAELSFRVQDLKALVKRNKIVMELYPVNEDKVQIYENKVTLIDQKQPLESAIDFSTGLETPTFVGSISLSEDNTGHSLWIVDQNNINTVFPAGNNSPADTKFIVKKLIDEGKKTAEQHQQKIRLLAEKTTFAKENNLDLLSLKKTQLKDINPTDIQQVINSGTFTPQISNKFCDFWINHYFPHILPGRKLSSASAYIFKWNCERMVKKNPARFFKVTKQLMIKNVYGSEFVKGLNHTLSVGAGFSMANAHSASHSGSVSGGANLGIKNEFGKFFGLGADVGVSMSSSVSDSESFSNFISVSSSTTLNVQQSLFRIFTNRYEQCVVIKLNPLLFLADESSWLIKFSFADILPSGLSQEQINDVTTRGLMICEDQIRTEPKSLTENYYLIAQDGSNGPMQDNGDSRNRNFFIALRSTSDFERFVYLMKGGANTPSSSTRTEDTPDHMSALLRQLFQKATPAYPGIFKM